MAIPRPSGGSGTRLGAPTLFGLGLRSLRT